MVFSINNEICSAFFVNSFCNNVWIELSVKVNFSVNVCVCTSKIFLKLSFKKNNPGSKIDSELILDINVLHITYHQVFLERLISFFKVDLNEDIANRAWEKLLNARTSAQRAIKNSLNKTNLLQVSIKPRKILIPVNKYDVKSTKILLVDLGEVKIENFKNIKIPKDNSKTLFDEKYKEKYVINLESLTLNYYKTFNQMLLNKNKYGIITNLSGKLYFGFLGDDYSNMKYPQIFFYLDLYNLILFMNKNIYTILMFLIDIMKPTKDADLWSQLNSSKEEIKSNANIAGKVSKRNKLFQNYSDYFAVLSGGYIYFYNTVIMNKN